MFVLAALTLLIGGLWLTGSLLWAMVKLCFGLVGFVCWALFAALGLVIALPLLLLLAPFLLLAAIIHLIFPLAVIAAIVYLLSGKPRARARAL